MVENINPGAVVVMLPNPSDRWEHSGILQRPNNWTHPRFWIRSKHGSNANDGAPKTAQMQDNPEGSELDPT